MTDLLLAGLKLAVGLMILGIGSTATVADLGLLWRRPWLLLRSLVPLAAVMLVKLLPIPTPTIAPCWRWPARRATWASPSLWPRRTRGRASSC